MMKMRPRDRPTIVLTVVLVGSLLCVGAAGALAVSDGVLQQERGTPETGQQLATVITVTDDEVRHDITVSRLDRAVDRGDEQELAAALADRATELRERASTVAAEFETATAAYENGTLSQSEYAWRLAILNGKATTIQDGIDHVRSRSEAVSPSVLEDAGYDEDALADVQAELEPLTGSGLATLLAQYTGEASGSFSVDAGNGLSLEVETDSGERSREFQRERSGNGSIVVTASVALERARGSLGGTDGNWSLTTLELDRDEGTYELGFVYRSQTHVGEAEVLVDAATGQVFSLEEQLEPRDDERVLGIDVHDGRLERGQPVTFVVTLDGEPVEGATVYVNDKRRGLTDGTGTITLSLPDTEDVEITAEHLDATAEFELELDPPESGDRDDRGENGDDDRDDDTSDDDDGDDDTSDDDDSDDDDAGDDDEGDDDSGDDEGDDGDDAGEDDGDDGDDDDRDDNERDDDGDDEDEDDGDGDDGDGDDEEL